MWKRNISGKCHDVDMGSTTIHDGSTSHTIRGLEEDSTYTITVTATNAAGSVVSDPVTQMTEEAGEAPTFTYFCIYTCMLVGLVHLFIQYHLLLQFWSEHQM